MNVEDFIKNKGYVNCMVFHSQPGNGISTRLREINKNMTGKLPCLYYSARHISGSLLKPSERKIWADNLFSYNLIILDDIDYWYNKKKAATDFIHWLTVKIRHSEGKVILGCSNPKKDWTRSVNFSAGFNHFRIEISNPSYIDILTLLQNLCQYEYCIPEKLLHHIALYNGTFSQYINCLISVRFQSKLNGLNLFKMSENEWNEKFKIKSFFPQYQLRKAFLSEWEFKPSNPILS